MELSKSRFPRFLLGLSCVLASAQTKTDLATQAKRIDFSAFPFTRPVKVGVTPPATCTTGDLFFKTDAAPGANLLACLANNTWQTLGNVLPSQGSTFQQILASDGTNTFWASLAGDISGSPTAARVDKILNRPLSATSPTTGYALVWNGASWEPQAAPNGSLGLSLDGTLLATRGRLNVINGLGILSTLTDTGTQVNLQHDFDSTVVMPRDEYMSSAALACNSASASSSSYTCTLNLPLAGYTAGMTLHWKPDVNGAGGATTLKIGSLSAVPLKLADGATDPRVFDLAAGQMYPIWFDGTAFRLFTIPAAQSVAASRPACSAAQRGRIWMITNASGVKDELAVCAKAADDSYAWRVLY